MTRTEIQHHVDRHRITWEQVYETLVNAHVPPDEIAAFIGGTPLLGVYADVMLRQLIASGEVPLQPLAG